MDINEIPQEQTVGFPAGVSEHEYATREETIAFAEGVNLPDDTDVETGTPFQRGTAWVVRVRVGNFE